MKNITIIEENIKLSEGLMGEYNRIFTDIVCYLRVSNVSFYFVFLILKIHLLPGVLKHWLHEIHFGLCVSPLSHLLIK